MTDQIPADEVRKIVNDMRSHADHDAVRGREEEYVRHFADLLDALLPSPPRPTLADMTDDEQDECRWMQADVDGITGRWLILNPYDEDGDVEAVLESGRKEYFSPDRVTPRPDLPRMEWPGDKKPAPVPSLPGGWRLADHEKRGRVIVTNTTPNRNGRVHFVLPADGPEGYGWNVCDPDNLTYLDGDQEADTPTGPDTLAVGTVIESADDPRIADLPFGSILLDRNEEATTKRHWGWSGAGFSPIVYERDRFAPWTVLHIPKGDGQ